MLLRRVLNVIPVTVLLISVLHAPQSHEQPDFVMMSNGGGTHSQLARRDIESCQSCHDAAGQDPVCAQCHLNPNIINGKDIK